MVFLQSFTHKSSHSPDGEGTAWIGEQYFWFGFFFFFGGGSFLGVAYFFSCLRQFFFEIPLRNYLTFSERATLRAGSVCVWGWADGTCLAIRLRCRSPLPAAAAPRSPGGRPPPRGRELGGLRAPRPAAGHHCHLLRAPRYWRSRPPVAPRSPGGRPRWRPPRDRGTTGDQAVRRMRRMRSARSAPHLDVGVHQQHRSAKDGVKQI